MDDEEDRAIRVEAFGSNRLAERQEVSFWQLVLEALEVRFALPNGPEQGLRIKCWVAGLRLPNRSKPTR